MSFRQVGIGPVHFRAAAAGDYLAQYEIAIGLTLQAEKLAAEAPQFANELLATAEFAANLAYQHGAPAAIALRGYVFAVRTWVLAASDPVRSLGYRDSAFADLDDAIASGNADALQIAALTLTRLADAGDEEAANKLNTVQAALSPEDAIELREAMREAAKAEAK